MAMERNDVRIDLDMDREDLWRRIGRNRLESVEMERHALRERETVLWYEEG